MFRQHRERLERTGGGRDMVFLMLEDVAEHVEHHRLVIDDEEGGRLGGGIGIVHDRPWTGAGEAWGGG